MRKYFVEKYKFYKFLEDLNETPDSATSPVYYFKQVDEIVLDITDFFTYFIRDRKKENFQCCIFVKPKTNRIGLTSIPVFQMDLDETIFCSAVFNENIVYLSDFLRFAFSDCVEYTQSMFDAVQNYEILKR